jgi:hypothetical protein
MGAVRDGLVTGAQNTDERPTVRARASRAFQGRGRTSHAWAAMKHRRALGIEC